MSKTRAVKFSGRLVRSFPHRRCDTGTRPGSHHRQRERQLQGRSARPVPGRLAGRSVAGRHAAESVHSAGPPHVRRTSRQERDVLHRDRCGKSWQDAVGRKEHQPADDHPGRVRRSEDARRTAARLRPDVRAVLTQLSPGRRVAVADRLRRVHIHDVGVDPVGRPGATPGSRREGFFFDNHLEYRLGAFQGARETGSHNSFRYAGRVQYQFLEPEATGFFYTGTYLGKKKVASVAAAFDTQDEYNAYDTDAFFDYPIGPGALTAQAGYNRIDGDTMFTTLPKQNVDPARAGLSDPRHQAHARCSSSPSETSIDTRSGDEKRWSLGVNYWWAAHNANVKAAYGRIDPVDDQAAESVHGPVSVVLLLKC